MLNVRGAIAVVALLTCHQALAGDTYATVSGGIDLSTSFEGSGPHASFAAEPDAGYTASAALGTYVDAVPGARVELEASWRHADLGGMLDVCHDSGPLSGSDGTFAAMLNAAYEYPIEGFRPYVMAGAGYGFRRIVIEPTPDNWENTSTGTERAGFVWQVGAGVEYPINDRVSVGVGYRYFVAPDIDRVAIFDGKSTFFEASGDHHTVVATLTVVID